MCVTLRPQSPWYNCTGWLGVKHKFTYLLVPKVFWTHQRIWSLVSRLSTVGSRAFSVFSPSAWNDLALPLRWKPSLDTFKSNFDISFFQNSRPAVFFSLHFTLIFSSASGLSLGWSCVWIKFCAVSLLVRAGACVSDACICAEQSLQTRFYSSKNTLLLLLLVIRNGEVRVNSNYIHDGVQHDNLRLK